MRPLKRIIAMAVVAAIPLLTLFVAIPELGADRTKLPRNHGERHVGREWQVIFVASSHCPACNVPGLRQAVVDMIWELDRQVRSIGDKPTTLAAVTDDRHEDAIGFIRDYGEFDELHLGRNWLNQSVLKYMLRDHPGTGATPSVLIVTRAVELTGDGSFMVGPDSVVTRLVGPTAITDYSAWIRGLIAELPLSDESDSVSLAESR